MSENFQLKIIEYFDELYRMLFAYLCKWID